ncbi:MAG: hypothetical protein JXR65_13075 [Bacteroidales bacterium]|nr:hypothetical protein [Bacteroidales bacterium]
MKSETTQAANEAAETASIEATEPTVENTNSEKIISEEDRLQLATMPIVEDFEPMPIGGPNQQDLSFILNVYEVIAKQTNALKHQLEECLGITTPYPVDSFIEFLHADPKVWIYDEYIRITDMKPIRPGENLHVVLDGGSVPAPNIEMVLELKESLLRTFDRMKEVKFYYPLRKLWNEKQNEFDTVENSFFEDAINFFSWFTISPKQNEVLDKMKNVCEALNELVKLGVLRPKNGIYEFDVLAEMIEVNRFVDPKKNEYAEAFTLPRHLFLKRRMNQFGGNTIIFHHTQEKRPYLKKANIYETV